MQQQEGRVEFALSVEEREFLPLIRQRYAGDRNIETVFAILDRAVTEIDSLRCELAVEKEITANLEWAVKSAMEELGFAKRLYNSQLNAGSAPTDFRKPPLG